MKLLPLLLSLYILGLSCLPCGDNAVCAEDSASFDITDSGHDEHEHHADLCSPFCVCICCGMTVTHHFYTTTFSEISPVSQTACSDLTLSFIPEVYLNIWQPPKIS